MVIITNEIIYKNRIETILEDYLMNHTNQYPYGCMVKLDILDRQIVAKVTPVIYNDIGTTSTISV